MITRKQQRSTPSTQSGFTIIESLMAIIIVSILMTALAPVIVLSVATRVQAKRVELATQAARTYIDGVNSGAITPPQQYVSLNETQTTSGKTTFTPHRDTFANTAAPSSSSLPCTLSPPTTGARTYYCKDSSTLSLYCIDIDGSGCSSSSNKDLIIQAYRSTTSATGDDTDKGYLLAVRVYRADAFTGGRTLIAGTKQQTYTGGTGLGQSQAPLVEKVVEIAVKGSAGSGTTYQDYCKRLGGCNL